MDTLFEADQLEAKTSPLQAQLCELQVEYYGRKSASVRDLREFFDSGADSLVTLLIEINVMDMLMVQRGLRALLPDWTIEREVRYSSESSLIVTRHAVEIAPKVFDYVIREGRQYWRGPAGEAMAVDVYVDEDRRNPYSEVRFVIERERHPWLREMLDRLRPWIDQNHFLRGQAVRADANFITFKEKVTWEDVMLPPKVRQSIEENCIHLLRHAELFRANEVPLKRGIILHGKPGTGKTMTGKALAQHCPATFILATPGILEDADDVRRMFEWGKRFAPSILFFEDFDLVAGSRERGSGDGLLGEFLSCLDGIDSSDGLIVIATTNNLMAIEPALKDRPNRFDCLLEVPEMAPAEREQFLRRWEKKHGGELDVAKLVRRTGGYTGAQLQELCRLAVFEAVHEHVRETDGQPKLLPLRNDFFSRAFEKMSVKSRAVIGFNMGDPDES